MTIDLKQNILDYYKCIVQDKIDVFQDRITALTEDSRNDAKGSAGDKHEIAISMMQIEQEKLNYKLKEFYDQQAILNRINGQIDHKIITIGSLVQTSNWLVFICTALPKVILNKQVVYAISPQSPLGSSLMGKQKNEEFVLHSKNYAIEGVI